jgi:hypothetical protein
MRKDLAFNVRVFTIAGVPIGVSDGVRDTWESVGLEHEGGEQAMSGWGYGGV